MTLAAVSKFNSTSPFFHLAVDGGPLIQSAVVSHGSASRGHCSGAAAASVPLVNNRKGSLLQPAVGPPDPSQAAQQPGAPEEAGQLQWTCSLPVKYRRCPGHSSNATLDHRHRKGHVHTQPLNPSPPACVAATDVAKHVLARLQWLHVQHSSLTTQRVQLSAVQH